MTRILFFILSAELFNSFGQILFKKSSNICAPSDLNSLNAAFGFLIKVVAVPWIWIGLGLMTVGLFAWLMAIAQGDLSLVYPMGSLYYVFVLILARIFLGERVNKTKLFGTALVGAGIIIMTRS